jgi:signal transduction histidine kinase
MSSRLSLLSQKLELIFKETDINALVAGTVTELKDLISAPIEQNLNKIPTLAIDREHIHKVLENLLMNAYDAAGKGGHIHVATYEHQNWMEISISDDGCGMSKEFMEQKLFRPFQTTKKQGMGIGLYHCKTIVEGHGGRIKVQGSRKTRPHNHA